MKTLIRYILFGFFACLTFTGYGQQDAMFTHYMYNTLAVNPGYAGSREAMTVTALHRAQWVDYKGAPVTQTLTLHSPLKSEKIGLGFSMINDKIGPVKTTAMYGDFAYILKLNSRSKLSFGLKAGLSLMQANLTPLTLEDQSDITFQSNLKSKLLPNFGFGMYYSRQRFYAGISAPRLLENDYSKNESGAVKKIGNEQRHYYLITGAMFRLSDNIDLKPTTLIKVTMAAPIEADLTATFICHKKLLLGVNWRTNDALGALIGYNITEQFHVGYSFDWSYGLRTFKYNNGTHEVMLSYDFIFKDKGKITSPRFF